MPGCQKFSGFDPLTRSVALLPQFPQPNLSDRKIFLERITLFAGDHNIFLGRTAPARERNQMLHGELLTWESLLTKVADTFADLLLPPG